MTSLEIAARVKGRDAYVDSWTVEKLWKVAEAIARARDASLGQDLEDTLVEAWRNLAKLGTWLAGNTHSYWEEAVRAAFEEGQEAMLDHLAKLLAPILDRC